MTNSQLAPPCQIGDRVECAASFGTVKYIGPLENRPSIWLGIDWDDPERGKHDGTVNGKKYFDTSHPTSGSFLRPEKVKFGRTAICSIESRYGQSEDELTAKVNQQKHLLIQRKMNAPFLEMVGFDKVFSKQSNLNTLKIVNLREQGVSSAGPPFSLKQTCPNVEEVDISKNLLSSWSEVLTICEQLPKLNWLNVSENRLTFPDDFEESRLFSVETLICGSMHLTWSDVRRIARVFPELKEFRAPHNKITNLDCNGLFAKLNVLDLEGNGIANWPEVCKLGNLQHLEHLILENIALVSINFEEEHVSLFKRLQKLCLVDNLLSDWISVSELDKLRALEHLKISKNPICDSEDHETVHQLIIARIGSLKFLNGVEIEDGERRGAEYDYIKKYGLEWLKVKGTEAELGFLKAHRRYLELIEKYGEPEESELVVKPKIIKSSLIGLKVIFEDFSVDKKIPQTMTVEKLRVLCQKLFKLGEKPSLTYVSSSDNIEIELDDEMKEIGLYSMQNGDKIVVKQ